MASMLPLSVHAQALRLDAQGRDRLAALVTGVTAHEGTKGEVVPIGRARGRAACEAKIADQQGFPCIMRR